MALSPKLAKLHNVFHVSMLWRYRYDEYHILPVQDIQLQSDFTFDEEPKAILDREVKKIEEQVSPSGKGALATPRYGRSNLGTRIDNESTVPTTLQFRY